MAPYFECGQQRQDERQLQTSQVAVLSPRVRVWVLGQERVRVLAQPNSTFFVGECQINIKEPGKSHRKAQFKPMHLNDGEEFRDFDRKSVGTDPFGKGPHVEFRTVEQHGAMSEASKKAVPDLAV